MGCSSTFNACHAKGWYISGGNTYVEQVEDVLLDAAP